MSGAQDASSHTPVASAPGNHSLAQDGGVATEDLSSTIPDEQWVKVTREFFLT
jgi:hypothetical protein